MMVDMSWFQKPIKGTSEQARRKVRDHFARNATGSCSLGRLEEVAVWLAGMQNSATPTVDPARVVVFAADHGIARVLTLSKPGQTTRDRTLACLMGQTPISLLCRQLDVSFEVVDVGMHASADPSTGLINQSSGSGTADFRTRSAMTGRQMTGALRAGRDAVNRALHDGVWLFIGGEIGVGKTTSAAAIASALLGLPPDLVAGGAPGESRELFAQRVEAIQTSLDFHLPAHPTPLETLRRLGGFEIAALCGAYVACGQAGLPALVDGFTATTAALVAIVIHPPLKQWLMFAHRSAEPGHQPLLKALDASPVLDLDISLGEGAGAIASLSLLRLACLLARDPE